MNDLEPMNQKIGKEKRKERVILPSYYSKELSGTRNRVAPSITPQSSGGRRGEMAALCADGSVRE